MTTLDEINKKYDEKEAEIQKEISIDFDSVLNQIHTKFEQDYRDLGNVKKEKRELKDRISELKIILKLFKKEIKILTTNKKRILKQKLAELDKEKANEIKELSANGE